MLRFPVLLGAQARQGTEHPLDATTTRSLTGLGYPAPGLPSKFFDQDMQPLVEIVRTRSAATTPSRSPATPNSTRTWAIPATSTARTISTARSSLMGSRRAKAGWRSTSSTTPASTPRTSSISTSRGRAPATTCCCARITDLVCVSSACPDDIDAANAWNPTDIHVRIYSDKESFSRAVAHRMTPDAEPS